MDSACLLCGAPLPAASDAATLVCCPSCGVELTSGATVLGLSTDSGMGAGAAARIELTPAFLERWTLRARLGAGAMGVVFLAQDRRDGRRVAVKFMIANEDRDLRRRFIREGRILQRVRDPHVVRLLDLDQMSDHPYLVSEFVTGGSLRDRLAKGPLPWVDAARIAAGCLRGLAALHAAGIVHRDVKPENLLLTEAGEAKVADLGIARVANVGGGTRAMSLIGTPQYMAPEQLVGGEVSPATDIFAMGLVLAELLTARRVRTARNLGELLDGAARPVVLPLDALAAAAPRPIVDVIHQLVAQAPGDRLLAQQAIEKLELTWRVAGTRERARSADVAPLTLPAPKVEQLPEEPESEHPVLALIAAGVSWLLASEAIAFVVLLAITSTVLGYLHPITGGLAVLFGMPLLAVRPILSSFWESRKMTGEDARIKLAEAPPERPAGQVRLPWRQNEMAPEARPERVLKVRDKVKHTDGKGKN